MNRTIRWTQVLIVALALALVTTAGSAVAAEKDDPADVTTGSAHISLPTEFAIPFKDGERYEEHEFQKDGRLLILPSLDRSETHVFELRPVSDKFAPATIEITPACWKLKKVSKAVKAWRCDLTAKFPKGTPAAPTAPPKEPEPEEDPDVPPMPGVPPPPPEYEQ